MLIRSLLILAALLAMATPAWAGIYKTIDAMPQEIRFSTNYRVFRDAVLENLRTIPVPNPKTDPTIRRRYRLIEAVGRDQKLPLDTLEEKLNFSAVLIHRGRADEAARFLVQVDFDHPKNFLVLSQYATALFLASDPQMRLQSGRYMKKALDNWPTDWKDLKEDQQHYLSRTLGWEGTLFANARRYETYFKRLIDHRLAEDQRRKKKEVVEDTLDPIFVDEKDNTPVKFVNNKGEWTAGAIPGGEKEKLPRDYIEAVEQLLIWMPNDERLFWLLGEVFNASVMDKKKDAERGQALEDVQAIFMRWDMLELPFRYGRDKIITRKRALDAALAALPHANPENDINQQLDDIEKKKKDPELIGRDWWRTIAVGFVTGFAVGFFALWQVQEMRRRRQTRAAATR